VPTIALTLDQPKRKSLNSSESKSFDEPKHERLDEPQPDGFH
jgi:hypothetical protein